MDKGLLQSVFHPDTASPSGYVLNELASSSFNQIDGCSFLVDYLMRKLKKDDPATKFKSLRIIKHICDRGSPEFRHVVQRHIHQIRLCQNYRGPIDPLYGDSLSELVREEACSCINLIYNSGTSNSNSIYKKINSNYNNSVLANEYAKPNDRNHMNSNESLRIKNLSRRIEGFGSHYFSRDIGGINSDNRYLSSYGYYTSKIESSNNVKNNFTIHNISQIGNSILVNTQSGNFGQVIEDLSDVILKVIPSKMIDSFSKYCKSANSNQEFSGSASNFSNKFPVSHSRKDFSTFQQTNMSSSSEFKPPLTNIKDSRGIWETPFTTQSSKCLSSFKSPEFTEAKLTSIPNILEKNLIDSFCSPCGLKVTPSHELLQEYVQKSVKLDVCVVISKLHERLKLYIESSIEWKVVYRILCLYIALLEMNEISKTALIEYVFNKNNDSNFIELLKSINEDYHPMCYRKSQQLQQSLNKSNTSQFSSEFSDKSEDLLDLTSKDDNNIFKKGVNCSVSKLFGNLSIKGIQPRKYSQQENTQTTNNSLIDLEF
ncbi:hypothetical protein cand_031780 [Cryptosporidium andersoni]|uniref:ENTH domain-containing protein n=1 Tax=Cryptosporidium andersoni TaxID=117008 RepID=A0A1J4MB63_9CRYT|nr:hypothetical protein cand_031780 [Cryptosporidium andersoni]